MAPVPPPPPPQPPTHPSTYPPPHSRTVTGGSITWRDGSGALLEHPASADIRTSLSGAETPSLRARVANVYRRTGEAPRHWLARLLLTAWTLLRGALALLKRGLVTGYLTLVALVRRLLLLPYRSRTTVTL